MERSIVIVGIAVIVVVVVVDSEKLIGIASRVLPEMRTCRHVTLYDVALLALSNRERPCTGSLPSFGHRRGRRKFLHRRLALVNTGKGHTANWLTDVEHRWIELDEQLDTSWSIVRHGGK